MDISWALYFLRHGFFMLYNETINTNNINFIRRKLK